MYLFSRAAKFFESLQPNQAGLFITFNDDGWSYFRVWMSNPMVQRYTDSLEVTLNQGLFTGSTRYEVKLGFIPGRSISILKKLLDLELMEASAPNGQIATKILHDRKNGKLDTDAPGA